MLRTMKYSAWARKNVAVRFSAQKYFLDMQSMWSKQTAVETSPTLHGSSKYYEKTLGA